MDIDIQQLHTDLKKAFITEPTNTEVLLETVSIISEEPVPDTQDVIIDGGLHYHRNEKNVINTFITYLKDKLDLETIPTVHILDKRQKGMTYGSFDPATNQIRVYGKNRGLADVLRTTAHELRHYWQKVQDKMPKRLIGRDQDLEADANTVAGDLIYMFGLEHPEVYELGDVNPDVVEIPKD